MTWTIELPYGAPPLSQNRRLHWAVERRLRQNLLHAVTLLAQAGKLPKGLDRVLVTLHWQPSIQRRRDTDNPAPTVKAAVDALTRYGLVEDDDSTHVLSDCVIHPLRSPARTWLTIDDLGERET